MSDEERAQEVADLIDAIYVQQRTDETDELCEKAKAAWDALTDEQKEMVEGEDVEKYDVLLSLAITGGDYSWI